MLTTVTCVTEEVFDVDVVADYDEDTGEYIEPDDNSFYDALHDVFFRVFGNISDTIIEWDYEEVDCVQDDDVFEYKVKFKLIFENKYA